VVLRLVLGCSLLIECCRNDHCNFPRFFNITLGFNAVCWLRGTCYYFVHSIANYLFLNWKFETLLFCRGWAFQQNEPRVIKKKYSIRTSFEVGWFWIWADWFDNWLHRIRFLQSPSAFGSGSFRKWRAWGVLQWCFVRAEWYCRICLKHKF